MNVLNMQSGAAMTANSAQEFTYGFFWHYTEARRIEIQAAFAGRITAPVPAVVDDFGTLVATGDAA